MSENVFAAVICLVLTVVAVDLFVRGDERPILTLMVLGLLSVPAIGVAAAYQAIVG